MTGYDFDKTIYRGDSSVDFFFYMLLKRPYLLIFSLWFLFVFMLYGLKIISKKKFKEWVFFFVPWHHNINRLVDKFWAKNANKIENWYCEQRQQTDIVITASLSFIVKPVLDMLDVKNFIATNFSIKTGKIIGENCYGEEKLSEFKRNYPRQTLDAFYSDSMSDAPMFGISQKAFLVTNGKIQEIKNN